MNLSMMFTNNYNDIARTAKLITQRSNKGKHIDLINATYLTVHEENLDYPTDNGRFVRFFSKCMKNTYKFNNSHFNQLHRTNELPLNEYDLKSEEELPVKLDVEKCKCKLLEHEQILFELYFEKGITYRKIADLYTGDGYRITKQSVNAMILTIKNKIKKTHYEGVY